MPTTLMAAHGNELTQSNDSAITGASGVFWVARPRPERAFTAKELPPVLYDRWTIDSKEGVMLLRGILDVGGVSGQYPQRQTDPQRQTAVAASVHEEPPYLVDALLDIYGIEAEDLIDGEPMPSRHTKDIAAQTLRSLYRHWPLAYGAYPEMGGSIAIDTPTRPGTRILVICEGDGTAVCLVRDGTRPMKKEYSDPSAIPDHFIETAMELLLVQESS